jgi:hypothetical protein
METEYDSVKRRDTNIWNKLIRERERERERDRDRERETEIDK